MDISELIKEAKKHHEVDAKKIRNAFEFAQKAHAGQTRMSGEPYITHPLAVTMILAEYGADEETLIAALLHDVIEDTQYGLDEISQNFGKTVARMVDTLTKLPHSGVHAAAHYPQFDSKIESIRKLFDVMQQDVRVIVIKLCDRLHNMKTLGHFRKEKRHRIAQESLDIYVRIAQRLSLYEIKERMQDLCYEFLYPEQYTRSMKFLHSQKTNFEKAKHYMTEKFSQDELLKERVSVEFKHYVPFANIKKLASDITEPPESKIQIYLQMKDEESCYLALRAIHNLWKNVRGSMKDFISLPKSNGYQGLSTVVLKSEGTFIHFVIQTPEMYEYGRRGVMLQCFSSHSSERKIHLPWVEKLKKIHQKTKDKSIDYLAALENDILQGAIIIYTDNDKTVFLPPKSTALDAAFYHLGKKGQYLKSVTINDRPRPFGSFLRDGDHLHFDLSDHIELQSGWLEMVNTSFGKSSIYDIIAQRSIEQRFSFGQMLLQDELKKRESGYLEEVDLTALTHSLHEYGLKTFKDLCLQVSVGDLSVRTACEIIFSARPKKLRRNSVQYEMELELLPNKYQTLASLMHLFERSEIAMNSMSVVKPLNNGITVKAFVTLPQHLYDSFLKSLKGLYDVRYVQLYDSRKLKVGGWLTLLFMTLTALDPIAAYWLINFQNIHFLDLLGFRFISVFIAISVVLLVRRLKSNYTEEAPIDYRNKYFFFSCASLFLTAFFTYLSFDQHITPFLYQFVIYLLIYPFVHIYHKRQYPLHLYVFLGFNLTLFVSYLFFATRHISTFDTGTIFYPLAAAVFFILYSLSSVRFQTEQHIYRRYLSFFRLLSLFCAIFTFVPLLFREVSFVPTLEEVFLSFGFSIIFVLIPYILYFIISGIYHYTSSQWTKYVNILILIKLGEVFILGLPVNAIDFVAIALFIGGYLTYLKYIKKTDAYLRILPKV